MVHDGMAHSDMPLSNFNMILQIVNNSRIRVFAGENYTLISKVPKAQT